MPMRRESGRASGTGKPKKIRKVKQNPQTSSLGSNAAAAHGYSRPKNKPVPAQQKSPRTDLRQAAAKATDAEKQVVYDTKMRRKAPADAARQQKIVDTENRLTAAVNAKNPARGVQRGGGKVRYDPRTGNYVQHNVRRFLPDENIVVNPGSGKASVNIDAVKRQSDVQHAEVVAPALKVLDQTMRTTRASAGGVEALVKGKGTRGVLKAWEKGLVHNKGPTFGKVLRDQGVPKGVAGVAGFGLDVAADPTTYVTGGTGKVSAKVAEKAAKDAAVKAAKAGLSEAGRKAASTAARKVASDPEVAGQVAARRAARQAAQAGADKEAAKAAGEAAAKKAADKVAKRNAKGTGITVKVAGKELPGVRRGTAAVGRQVRKRTPEPVKHAARETVSQVRPSVAPAGMSKEAYQAARQAERRARNRRAEGSRAAGDRGRLYAQHLKPEEHAQILAAYERGKVKELPEHLQQVAKALKNEYKAALRERKRSGVGAGEIGGERFKPIRVPEVTADVAGSHKALRAARAQRKKAERGQLSQYEKAGQARGRAELIVRRRKLAATTTTPKRTLAKLERERAGTMVSDAELRAAHKAERQAKLQHEATKAEAAAQRKARNRALAARERQRARQEGAATNYFPHMLEGNVEGTASKTSGPQGVRTIRPGSARQRKYKEPIDVRNTKVAEDERLSTNVPLVTANYLVEHGNAVAQTRLHRELADQGRRLKPGTEVQLRGNEKIYHNQGGALREVSPQEWSKLDPKKWDPAKNSGRYVAIDERLVENAKKLSADTRTAPGRIFDVAQGKWKRLATGTPGFHVRNAIGDTQMAFNAQGKAVPVTSTQAVRLLRRQTQREKAARKELIPGQALPRSTKTIKVGRERVNIDDFLDEMHRQGVLRSGYIGSELEHLREGVGGSAAAVEGETKAAMRGTAAARQRAKQIRKTVGESAPRRAVKNVGRSVNRGFQNREDLMRAATYLYGRRKGLSEQEAADLSMAFHIDYGDVTDFERKAARRIAPFYTFSARALPIHVKTLLKTPGRIAGIEKARVELSQAFGLPDNWEADASEWKQRNIPFGVKIKGENVALDASLPVNLLNEVPTTADPKAFLQEWQRFGGGMLTPAIKAPLEAATNYSFAFRSPIERPHKPYVAAPAWALKLPAKLREQLGVIPDLPDNRTGKKGAGWSVWTNYWANQLPGLAYQLKSLTTQGSLQSGRHDYQKVVGVAGVKADPIDPVTARIGELFNRMDKVNGQLDKMRARGVRGGQSSKNPEMVKLTKELARLNYQVYSMSVQRGDAKPYSEQQVPNKKLLKPRVTPRGMPAKKKPRSPFGGGGGLNGSLGSSGNLNGSLK